ncbi:hypothetical protein [Kordiimonas sp.]|uniref:hypothetical protein n=1 Tax=Kordiimonas sp. TaxID=1970157 RepID=UPI003B52B895
MFFDGGAGGLGPIGGASGPAYSGGSPVFQIAAADSGSILNDDFMGVGGTSATSVLAVAAVALAAGAGLVYFLKK